MSKMDQFSAAITIIGAFMCIAVASVCIGYGAWILLRWAIDRAKNKARTEEYATKREINIQSRSPYPEDEGWQSWP